ncbi:MAG: hypothetical protein ACYTX0_38180, partial [Nostoc sp.]
LEKSTNRKTHPRNKRKSLNIGFYTEDIILQICLKVGPLSSILIKRGKPKRSHLIKRGNTKRHRIARR